MVLSRRKISLCNFSNLKIFFKSAHLSAYNFTISISFVIIIDYCKSHYFKEINTNFNVLSLHNPKLHCPIIKSLDIFSFHVQVLFFPYTSTTHYSNPILLQKKDRHKQISRIYCIKAL